MTGDLDGEWLQQFESLRVETAVNFEPPESHWPVRLGPDILQFIADQGEVRLSCVNFFFNSLLIQE